MSINIKKIYTRMFIIPGRHIRYIYHSFLKEIMKKNFPKIQILSDLDTLDLILKEKKSVSRFGDGEISWILGTQKGSFQKGSELLSNRLTEVLNSSLDNLLLCLPSALNDLNGMDLNSKHFWSKMMHGQRFHIFYLIKKDVFGNSLFTRPYMIYKDKKEVKEKFKKIKLIWEKKDVVIIEGALTYFGVGNDLLENAKSIKRVIAPNENAFEKYDEILNQAKCIEKNTIVLIALGPTATVLAYDLTRLGYQAIDIGHVDIEYEWYLRGTKRKIPIPGKFVNEIEKKIEDENVLKKNLDYKNSIISVVE